MKLPILLIEVHSRCNCRCVMCDIWKSNQHREFSLAQLEAQLPALERLGTRWVVFTGGEPLMHSNVFALAAPLRERRIRVSLLSTGLLFERYAEHIHANFDDAILSLDGPPAVHDRIRGIPGAFDCIARGVHTLTQMNPSFPISSRCVVQKLNHAHLVETASTARSLGLKSISFLAADLTSTAFNRAQPWTSARQSEVALDVEDLPALTAQLESLTGDRFVTDSPQHLRRIAHHFRAHLGLAPSEAPRCNAPWVSAVLGIDGEVKPCFFHPPFASRGGRLDDILDSPSAQQFRNTLDTKTNPTCRNCVCSLYLEPVG